jgi:hypothetical protein
MRTGILICCMLPLLVAAQTASDKSGAKTTKTTKSKPTAAGWAKAKDNSWPGVVNEQTYRYKLVGSKLMWSADGKTWEEDSDGMWTDKEGVFYKLDGTKLVESTDAGNTWTETFEWKWEAVDGRWYKLDKDKVVWVGK